MCMRVDVYACEQPEEEIPTTLPTTEGTMCIYIFSQDETIFCSPIFIAEHQIRFNYES